MCGIAGEYRLNGVANEGSLAVVSDMTGALKHRGPDGESVSVVSQRAIFGMRRLAIIDLATGNQPFWTEDNTISCIFNGEIYNHRNIRRTLEQLGHKFRTDHADGEVIVHAYEEWGLSFVNRLVGMFAIALLDNTRDCCVLIRDRLGKKPLYYEYDQVDRVVRFASELSALPKRTRKLDPRAIADFLRLQYVRAPRTVWQGVSKLRAGEMAIFERSGVTTQTYWQLPPPNRPADVRLDHAVEQLDDLLRRSVRLRLESDVPVGVFLSGGIDSALVLSYCRELGAEPTAFTVGFKEGRFDESQAASRIAGVFGIPHYLRTLVRIDSEDLAQTLRQIDEPLGDAALYPTRILARLAREHVKVVLSGEGGDEIDGGYREYAREKRALGLIAVLPSWSLALARTSPIGFGKIARLLDLAALSSGHRTHHWPDLGPGRWISRLHPSLVQEPPLEWAGRSRLDSAIRRDFATWLADDLLTKVDRATMAEGLEARTPMLDHRLVDYSVMLPDCLKINGSRTKVALRRLAARRLPPDIVKLPKHSFDVPLKEWIAAGGARSWNQAKEVLSEADFQMNEISRLEAIARTGTQRALRMQWSLLALGLWLSNRTFTWR